MKKPILTYDQLRRILALCIDNGVIKAKLEDLLAGALVNITELELMEILKDSEIDLDMIRILSGKDPEEMDAMEGLEYISDFFAYMRANGAKLAGWLGSIGSSKPKGSKKAV